MSLLPINYLLCKTWTAFIFLYLAFKFIQSLSHTTGHFRIMHTFNDKLSAEPPESVLLHIAQPRRIRASAQVELYGIILCKKGLDHTE